MSDFLMPVDDLFAISGRGTVLMGRVLRGSVRVGDSVELVGLRPTREGLRVSSVETFRRTLETAVLGDQVGIVFEHLAKSDVEPGMVLAAPRRLRAARRFELVLDAAEAGSQPLLSLPPSGRARFQVFLAELDGEFEVIAGAPLRSSVDELRLVVGLARPMAMEVGSRCSIRFSTAGAPLGGRVSAILD